MEEWWIIQPARHGGARTRVGVIVVDWGVGNLGLGSIGTLYHFNVTATFFKQAKPK